jgi:predicted nucleic acid-binding protein
MPSWKPVVYELTRLATDAERKVLVAYFITMPILATLSDIWRKAAELGRACRRNGYTPGSMDLLISQLAIHHDADLVTFDRDYLDIASVSPLRVEYLHRPTGALLKSW